MDQLGSQSLQQTVYSDGEEKMVKSPTCGVAIQLYCNPNFGVLFQNSPGLGFAGARLLYDAGCFRVDQGGQYLFYLCDEPLGLLLTHIRCERATVSQRTTEPPMASMSAVLYDLHSFAILEIRISGARCHGFGPGPSPCSSQRLTCPVTLKRRWAHSWRP